MAPTTARTDPIHKEEVGEGRSRGEAQEESERGCCVTACESGKTRGVGTEAIEARQPGKKYGKGASVELPPIGRSHVRRLLKKGDGRGAREEMICKKTREDDRAAIGQAGRLQAGRGSQFWRLELSLSSTDACCMHSYHREQAGNRVPPGYTLRSPPSLSHSPLTYETATASSHRHLAPLYAYSAATYT